MSLASALLDLLFAPVCLGCDGRIAAADSARLVCRRCRSRLRPLPPPSCRRCGAPVPRAGAAGEGVCGDCRAWPLSLVSARSACAMVPPADRLVRQLKYRGWRSLAPLLAELMAAEAPPLPGHEPAICVPVPTSSRRVRARGYNQAAELAAGFARGTGRQLAAALSRVRANGSQTTLQPAARRANVAGAFAVAVGPADRLPGAHVILVDDVLTTGATAAECASVLAAAGVCCVRLVTFARAIDARRLIHI